MSWSECIDHGRVSKLGYAARWSGEAYKLHQAACPGWEPGLVAHHVCFNKRCINPAHLRAMTNSDHRHWHAMDAHRHQDHEMEIVVCGAARTRTCRICKNRRQNAREKALYHGDPEHRAWRLRLAKAKSGQRRERRAERYATDPGYKERVRRQARDNYHRRKRTEAANGKN